MPAGEDLPLATSVIPNLGATPRLNLWQIATTLLAPEILMAAVDRNRVEHEMLPKFDGCEVVEKVHSGPLADVYRAIQQPLGRPVIIKALAETILPDSPFAATLEREARLLAELCHPNILFIHDFVRRDDRMWLVVEYVDGWSLAEILEKQQRLPLAAATAIALELALALEHAHAAGIVHRDVQPKNVLLSRRAEVKLINFSVAVDGRLPTAPELFDGNTSFGAPEYMSPEQILGEPADPRSDLFSLGVLLHEMLSGQPPFTAPDERSATQRIRHEAPTPLGRHAPNVTPAIERIVQRCLEKLPGDRFDSARELGHALAAAMAEISDGSPRRHIAVALHEAQLIRELPADAVEGPASRRRDPRSDSPRATLRRAIGGIAVAAVAVVSGGGVLSYLSHRNDGASANRSGARLELAPENAAYLRVVAEPWAHVIVDGQRVDTTPFARPLPLKAGTHYVRLEHPNAPPETRAVKLTAGETVLLDVQMRVYPGSGPVEPDAGIQRDSGPVTP